MKKHNLFFLLIFCFNTSVFSQQQQIEELERELSNKNKKIEELEEKLSKTESENKPKFWYAFEPTTEYNIAKLSKGEFKVIDEVQLTDSVDIVHTFRHNTTISQIKDERLSGFFADYKEYQKILHRSKDYGPMAENLSYHVRTFIICEEEGLPIETENCIDNIYILVQPTELGLKNNLFKISRLFRTEIKSLEDSKVGVVLTLEHSRFPRKELKVLIKPQLVKFIN